MRTKAEHYRQLAKEAEEKAEQARDADAKRTWREVGSEWRKMMAEQAPSATGGDERR